MEMILGALMGLIVGMAAGWLARRSEVSNLIDYFHHTQESYEDSIERWKNTLEGQAESARGERERLLHHLVTMRRAGFIPMADGDDSGELESWALTNEHETEVSEARKEGLPKTQQEEIRGIVEEGIRS